MTRHRRASCAALLRALGMMLLLAVPAAAWANPPRHAQAAELSYVVFETADAQPEDPLPLIVALHYSGAEPEDLLAAFASLRVPARVVLPRGPQARARGRSWFPSGYSDLEAAQQAPLTEASLAQLQQFVEQVRQAHPTRERTIITGVSYGGDLSLLLALRHPQDYAAAFPVAARWLPAWLPARRDCAATCPRIHALHGSIDTTVPMAPTAAGIAQLAAMGYDARLTAYPDTTHDFSAAMQRDLRAELEALLAPAR